MTGNIYLHVFPRTEPDDEGERYVTKLHITSGGPDCWCEPIVAFSHNDHQAPGLRIHTVIHSTSILAFDICTRVIHPTGTF